MTGEDRFRRRCLDKLGWRFAGNEHPLDVGCDAEQVVAVDIDSSDGWTDEAMVSFSVADGPLQALAEETLQRLMVFGRILSCNDAVALAEASG